MTTKQLWAALRANWRIAPRSLVVVCVACSIASIGYLPVVFAPQAIREHLIQYLGWSPIMLFWGPALVAASAIAGRRRVSARVLVFMGLLSALSAVWHAHGLGKGSQFPYFKVSPWLVAWEVALAIVLVIVGTSPRIQAFCENEP